VRVVVVVGVNPISRTASAVKNNFDKNPKFKETKTT
jgi:hypothetical protein